MRVLGTTFETSLRVLLLLFAASGNEMSEERICALDYISVYAGDYGFSSSNLHGYGSYRFSEYPQRRELIRESIKQLVLDRMIVPIITEKGFTYRVTDEGRSFSRKLSTDYAEDYLESASKVLRMTKGMTDTQLLKLINSNSSVGAEEVNET